MSSTIVVAGLGEWEKIHLVRSRKPEWELKSWEYIFKNKSWVVTAYRKDLALGTNNQPKALEWLKLNKVFIKEWEDTGKGKSWSFSILVSSNTGSHIMNLGGGMFGSDVLNSLFSLLSRTKEDLENTTFKFAFYQNKWGFNASTITDSQWESLRWYMTQEEKKSYIKDFWPDPRNPSKNMFDKSPLMEHYTMLANSLNALLPRWHSSEWMGLDDLDDDLSSTSVNTVQQDDADDIFDTPAPAPKAKAEPEDLPFV